MNQTQGATQKQTSSENSSRKTAFLGALFHQRTGWIVLAISLALTALAWQFSSEYVQKREEDKFNFQVTEIESAIVKRMKSYEYVLTAGVGLFNASEQVNRGEWRSFINALNPKRNFPGTQGIGVSLPILPSELQNHIANLKAEGFADYSVRPTGVREFYTSIVYLEPFDWRNQRALGFDMYSEKNRREAMDRAIDTGEASISAKVKLVQETEKDVQAGLLIYLPVYDSALEENATADTRRRNFRAMVYAVLRATDLMKNILNDVGDDVTLQLYDGQVSADSLLYQSVDSIEQYLEPRFIETASVSLYGHVWKMVVRSKTPGGWFYGSWESTVVGLFGIIVDILLFCVIHLIGKRGRQVERELYTASLERSNDDLSRFAYAASHDLKSPLRSIDNLAGWIAKDSKDVLGADSKRHLALLQSRAKRLENLLEDLLVYARVGTMNEKLQVVDCHELIHEVVDLAAIPDSFRVQTIGASPSVLISRIPIRQVFINLISNSIKHHDQRSGLIKIECQWRDGLLEIVVSDDGPGIPLEFHDKVFEMFSTLQSRDKQEGSGVGLALVRKLVTDHHGSIEVVSPPLSKCGTSIRFTWKADLAAAPESNTAPPKQTELESTV